MAERGVDVPLLAVDALSLELPRVDGSGRFWAFRELSLAVSPGEVVGILGASAAGKSLVAGALLGLVPAGGRLEARSMNIAGVSVAVEEDRAWGAVRGRRVGLVPQEARGSLDPMRTVGAQLSELGGTPAALAAAGLEDPERVARLYPHELSGGMAQRVALGLAWAPEPAVLVADEPTTGLDLPLRVELLARLRGWADGGRGLIFVSHDAGALRRISNRCLVMLAGGVAELGTRDQVLEAPKHPFTATWLGILDGTPSPISLERPPGGCPFHPDCPRASARCRTEPPVLSDEARRVACHHPLDGLG